MFCRFLQVTARLVLAVWMALAPVKVWAGSMTLLGVGGGSAAPTYTGPGDLAFGTWTVWGSTARVLQQSLASSSTSLADLVDSASPSSVICTLRGSTSGFVDLANSYCTGGLTPSAKCTAATGGKCNISKIYDQTGNTTGWSQTTAANQATLTFSALTGLPGITCAGSCNYAATITQAQPFAISVVYERTGALTTAQSIIGTTSGNINLGPTSSNNSLQGGAGAGSVSATATDNAFHAAQFIGNGASSSLYVDGSNSTGSPGTNAFSAAPFRLMTTSGSNTGMTGIVMEFGILPSASFASSTMNSNQHGSNGYNF